MRLVAVALVLSGCAPQLLAVRDRTTRDGVTVSFCGSERLKEESSGSVWMPGRGVGFGSSSTDTGQTTVCLTVANNSRGAVVVDRRRLRLVADGFRGVPLGDGQENKWPVDAGAEEDISVTFQTDSLERGDGVRLAFKDAVFLDGTPIRLAPLRFEYR